MATARPGRSCQRGYHAPAFMRAELNALLASWEYTFAMGHRCGGGDHPSASRAGERVESLRARIAAASSTASSSCDRVRQMRSAISSVLKLSTKLSASALSRRLRPTRPRPARRGQRASGCSRSTCIARTRPVVATRFGESKLSVAVAIARSSVALEGADRVSSYGASCGGMSRARSRIG